MRVLSLHSHSDEESVLAFRLNSPYICHYILPPAIRVHEPKPCLGIVIIHIKEPDCAIAYSGKGCGDGCRGDSCKESD